MQFTPTSFSTYFGQLQHNSATPCCFHCKSITQHHFQWLFQTMELIKQLLVTTHVAGCSWIHGPFIQGASGIRRQHVVNHQANTITIRTTAISSPHFSLIHPQLVAPGLLFIWVTLLLDPLQFRLMWPNFPQWWHLGPFPFGLCFPVVAPSLLLSEPTRSFSFLSPCSKRSVTNFILYDSGKLTSKCTTRSSSEIGSPITDNPSKISVIALIRSCTESPSFSLKVYDAVATCWPMFFCETDFLAFAIPH